MSISPTKRRPGAIQVKYSLPSDEAKLKLKEMHTETNPTMLDYYLLVGIDETQLCQLQVQPGDDIIEKSTTLTPKVLSQYPNFSKAGANIDDSYIASFCFPAGFSFKRGPKDQAAREPDPEYFSFVMTSENGQNLYGGCLRFYERLDFYIRNHRRNTINPQSPDIRKKYKQATSRDDSYLPNGRNSKKRSTDPKRPSKFNKYLADPDAVGGSKKKSMTLLKFSDDHDQDQDEKDDEEDPNSLPDFTTAREGRALYNRSFNRKGQLRSLVNDNGFFSQEGLNKGILRQKTTIGGIGSHNDIMEDSDEEDKLDQGESHQFVSNYDEHDLSMATNRTHLNGRSQSERQEDDHSSPSDDEGDEGDANQSSENFARAIESANHAFSNDRRSSRMVRSNSSVLKQETNNLNYFIYIPKCIVLVARFPFIETFKVFLYKILDQMKLCKTTPVERYIVNLISEIPLPPYGFTQIKFSLSQKLLSLSRPAPNELPLLDVNLVQIFSSLSIDNILLLLANVILERQVIIHSRQLAKLTRVGECIISFMFPFKLYSVYIPVLPRQCLDIVYAVVPFLVGLHSDLVDEIAFDECENITIFDLDNNKVEVPVDKLTDESDYIDNSIFPDHEREKVVKRLKEALGKSLDNEKRQKVRANTPMRREDIKVNSEARFLIRRAFLFFFVSIMKHYKKHCRTGQAPSGPFSIDHYFLQEEFKKAYPEQYRPFLGQLMTSQSFNKFIEQKVNPTDFKEVAEITFFDEHIDAKFNRYAISNLLGTKKATPFLNDKSNLVSKVYTVPEVDTANIPPSFKNSARSSLIQEFDYGLLNLECPFRKPPSLTNHYQEIGSKLPQLNVESGSRRSNNHTPDDTCIYIVWFAMWCALLGSQDPAERSFRFGEVLTMLERMNNTPEPPWRSIYTMILGFLNKYCEPATVYRFIEFMKENGIKPDAYILSIYSQALNKIRGNRGTLSVNGVAKEIQKLENMKKTNAIDRPDSLRERTFVNEREFNYYGDLVGFRIEHICDNCSAYNNFEQIKQGWSPQPNCFEFECYNCRNPAIPLLTVNVGRRTGKHNDCDGYRVEESMLLSPQTLNSNIDDLFFTDEHLLEVSLQDFAENKKFYWNLIWYFQYFNFPYDFLMPYVESMVEIQDDLKVEFAVVTDNSKNGTNSEKSTKDDKIGDIAQETILGKEDSRHRDISEYDTQTSLSSSVSTKSTTTTITPQLSFEDILRSIEGILPKSMQGDNSIQKIAQELKVQNFSGEVELARESSQEGQNDLYLKVVPKVH